MFDEWFEIEEEQLEGSKSLFLLEEKQGGRDVVRDRFIENVRAHYDNLERIAEDIAELGYPQASAILQERIPTTPRARSGEMGEILATEFMESKTDFHIPVRRLRYKDGREMALRGDDFLGVVENGEDQLLLLKGEAKSGRNISAGVVADARTKLSADDGRPNPISLLFVADRLLEAESADDQQLGRKLRNEIATKSIPSNRITHGLFTLWARITRNALENDLRAAEDSHTHLSVGLKIPDHQEFIAETYRQVGNLGDD